MIILINPTTFTNLGTAQTAINKALKEKSKEIAGWLESARVGSINNTLIKNFDIGKDLGFGYRNGSNDEIIKLQNLTKITVVLKKSKKTNNGFVVLTAYVVE